MLIVLPLVAWRVGERLHLDRQAANGLRLWLENFESVIYALPVALADAAPADTVDFHVQFAGAAVRIEPLPIAYGPLVFARTYRATARRLRVFIAEATHLQFAIGGLWGDWGAVAAILAHRAGRKAAIWTDRVESEVMAFQARSLSGPRRWYRQGIAKVAARYEAAVIRRSALGLFHGKDTFQAYAGFSKRAELVHDIHLGPEYRADPVQVAGKAGRPVNAPLRIVYGGRAHPDKGVADWIETLRLAAEDKLRFRASWFGIGPELAWARDAVNAAGLSHLIEFPGSAVSHDALMEELRHADLLLFCHKTAESPRALVEALLSGAPIIGYRSAYPEDLIHRNGGGVLTEPHPRALADALLALDRSALGRLARLAAADGRPMTDVEVFRHRSDLIKSL